MKKNSDLSATRKISRKFKETPPRQTGNIPLNLLLSQKKIIASNPGNQGTSRAFNQQFSFKLVNL